ncbi:MAG: PAS domain S-box protein [Candidatus Thiodiazotropha sp.]
MSKQSCRSGKIVTDVTGEELLFFEHLDLVNKTIQAASDLDSMLVDVLDVTLSIFDCDRAYLVYPCDPNADSWTIPMERTRPEYPGGGEAHASFPMLPELAAGMQVILDHPGPVTFGEGNANPHITEFLREFNIKSLMSMAIYPKVDKPWQFGIQQCSRERAWNATEVRLFQSIGRRISDGLSLRLTLKELQKREESYSRIVNLASEGIWSLDVEGNTNFVNSSLTELLGYTEEEMMGRPVTDFMFDEDIPDFLRKLAAGFKNVSSPYERRYRQKNGNEVWALVSAAGIHDEEGNYVGGFAMVTDITEKKKAEDALYKLNEELETKVVERTSELQKTNAELEETYEDLKHAHTQILQQEKMASIGQLASGIAHEINTPSQYVGNNISFIHESLNDLINGFEGFMKAVSDETASSKLRDKFEAILEEIDYDYLKQELPRSLTESAEGLMQISNIVIAMKDFAKPSNNVLEPVELSKLIDDTVKVSRNSWQRVAELEVEPIPENLVVDGLRDELGQVLLHLILNATDAIEGEVKGRIRILTQCSDNWAEIIVEDNGCGMTEEVRKRAFDPFFTTKQVDKGSGQGLAIGYNIITDKHGGELLVDSTPGKGSRFTVRLPVKA